MRINLSSHDLKAADHAHHLHPFTDHGTFGIDDRKVISRADGVWLWDTDGNRILDGMAGLWCVNVGHGRSEIVEAVRAQMSELSYYNTFFKTSHLPVIELSKMLAEVTPAHMNMVFYGSSGSDSNDTVLRMVRSYWDIMGKPDKKVIISRKNAYHGSTVAGASLGGMGGMHGQGDLPIPGIHHIEQPYWFGEGMQSGMSEADFGVWAAQELDRAIEELGEDKIAAFIAEPIQGAGGVIVPPDTYWPEVKKILDKRDILFISDEVICGFGRVGEWFGADYYGTTPDFMPIAKGLTSGYLPLGGVVMSDRVAEAFHNSAAGEFYHGYTYSGHPAACAAAIANLEIVKKEKLVERVRDDIGPVLQKFWHALGEHELVGEARMAGLFGALELVPDKSDLAKRFANVGRVGTIARDHSFKNGLVMRAVRDSLIISPPLTLSEEEAGLLAKAARKTLDDTWQTLKSEGLV
ncbi:aminotransferase [Pseudohoeflea coraliihabitans]|uniref:Aminotransferase class III-fold pyridoxal phosphate-dependent enzyme n=1 Tax=Pseudohoeflea coraliihabitans TaxID=2860393 RepID=A0ABS6WR07_9HYPH|nr:aminotransferase [Pseudohoeflea sp. DP4N28-3]MBW3098401.1 aminotransferase class III-fold pyridoxal phosphate-dependent enzyme [Pseudohoeflea sp. DP4N28-3]